MVLKSSYKPLKIECAAIGNGKIEDDLAMKPIETTTPASESADNKALILGVGVNSTRLQKVLTKIDKICRSGLKSRPFFIATVNPEFVMLAQTDSEFARIINAADLAIADGSGLKLSAPHLAEIIPGRKLVSRLVKCNYKIFYLGGRDGVAAKMVQEYGGQADTGHVDIKTQLDDPLENQRIVSRINAYRPDILLVAYGAPWQEKWLWANRNQLKAKVAMGVGGTFDYLVGKAKLPPAGIDKLGLEWLWRLINEPWRWKRQLRLMQFVIRVVFDKLG